MTTITVNGETLKVDAAPDTPLLWVLRDHLAMTGTKFGCGMALCGACTVHIDGVAMRSCILPLRALEGKTITTIEGLSQGRSHPLQRAWIELDVPQCGYCQSGMIMSVVALLSKRPNPTDTEIDAEITNACRCSSYHRVRQAIRVAASTMPAAGRAL